MVRLLLLFLMNIMFGNCRVRCSVTINVDFNPLLFSILRVLGNIHLEELEYMNAFQEAPANKDIAEIVKQISGKC